LQPIHFHLLAAGCSELPHRDGSRNGVHSRQNRDGTKQLYGIRPLHVPMQRQAEPVEALERLEVLERILAMN
jgi:hypothetical protein